MWMTELTTKTIAADSRMGSHSADRPVITTSVGSRITFVLERNLDLRSIALDLTVFQLHVELRDLGDTQVAQLLRRLPDRSGGRLLPGLGAGADQLDDFVDALWHVNLLVRFGSSPCSGQRLRCGLHGRGATAPCIRLRERGRGERSESAAPRRHLRWKSQREPDRAAGDPP